MKLSNAACTCPRLSGQPNNEDCPVHPSKTATAAGPVVDPGVMLTVGGKRFVCTCGASVFSKIGDEYRCNGCRRVYA